MRVFKLMATSAAAAVLCGTLAQAQPATDMSRSAEHVQAHMGFLASDLLKGREAGSIEYDIAAQYVAAQFRQLGLKPAGDKGTYFQAVPLVASRRAGEGAVTLNRGGATTPLVFGEDYLPGRIPDQAESSISAPLVFVGYGVVAPEHRRDDYRGLDVTGKIVVVLSGAPAGFQTEERAYYNDSETKREVAAAHGAVGLIQLYTPDVERRYPFAQSARSWQSWAMTWRQADGKPYAVGVPVLASLSVKGAEKLFAGARRSFAQVAAQAAKTSDPDRFALPSSASLSLRTETKVVMSENVAGLLEGSDPQLKDQVVVLSAHLDHLGTGAEVNGDSIYNGALDNAAGVATTLEVARTFNESGQPPRRSVLFLTVTGEEKGLLGAQYFAKNPTVSGPLVANVDLDMPLLTYDFKDVVAFGADRSAIGPAVQRAAARVGVALSPDPLPEEGLFTRSDHYRFVEAGVPAVFLMTGFQNGGEAKFRGFLANCYHKPCDDIAQPIDYLAGAKFARVNYEITRELADMPQRPTWNPGDFFGEKFGPKR